MTPEIRKSLQKEAVTSAPKLKWRTVPQAKAEVLHSAFKQKSVVHELDIVGHLLRATGGAMHFREALEYARGKDFVHLDGEGHVTTEIVRNEDKIVLNTLRAGWDKCEAMAPGHVIKNEKVLSAPDQKAAVEFILSSKDSTLDCSGIAGGGKSFLRSEKLVTTLSFWHPRQPPKRI
jgi:hypothetical protein